MQAKLALAAIFGAVLLVAAPSEARRLSQVDGVGRSTTSGSTGAQTTTRPAVVTSGVASTTSVGAIEADLIDRQGSQPSKYAEGISRATGQTAFGFQVAADSVRDRPSSASTAAADAIRQNAGYQGTSIAGDIFAGSRFDDSIAGRAIRRTNADNAALQARLASSQGDAERPFDV